MAPAAKKSRMTPVTLETVKEEGAMIMNRDVRSKSIVVFERRWKAVFGVKVETAFEAWERIVDGATLPNGAHVKHLLWGLLFLKVYFL